MRFSPDRSIDLNADLGEGPGEHPLYPLIASANIACGGHAGDGESMRQAVRLAMTHGVAIGAHPSYPDRERFGRVSLNLRPSQIVEAIAEQTASLVRIAAALGASVLHVKPHGALYGDAARRDDVAISVAEGVASVSEDLVLVGFAGSVALRVWRELGRRVAAEGFADRAYAADGTLVPRGQAGSLIEDAAAAGDQAVRIAKEGRCDTISVHADTRGAAAIASSVRLRLEDAGFAIRAFAHRRDRS